MIEFKIDEVVWFSFHLLPGPWRREPIERTEALFQGMYKYVGITDGNPEFVYIVCTKDKRSYWVQIGDLSKTRS